MKYIKYIHIVCSIACFALNKNLYADAAAGPEITFFFKPYPEFMVSEAENLKSSKKLARPDYASKQIIKDYIDPSVVNGIFAIYGGFITTSDPDGQISFPWRHKDPVVHIIITTRITPIMMNTTTIDHWELEEKAPAAMYKMEWMKDPDTKLTMWNVSKEDLPKDRILPAKFPYILIFAKPENIYIPLGATVVLDNVPPLHSPDQPANLHLPDIYVKPEINKLSNSLYILYLRHFFGPLKKALKKETNTHYDINLIY